MRLRLESGLRVLVCLFFGFGGCRREQREAGSSVPEAAAPAWPLVMDCSGLRVRIRVVGPDIFRFECSPADSAGLPATAKGWLPLSGGGKAWLTCDPALGALAVRAEGRTVWAGQVELPESFARAGLPGVELSWKAGGGECLYGPSSGRPGLNRFGERMEPWGNRPTDTRAGSLNAKGMAASVLYSSCGYALFFGDSLDGLLDLNSSGDGFHRYRRAGWSTTFDLALGNSLRDLVVKRMSAAGPSRSVPEWAWGVWIHEDNSPSHDALIEMTGEMLKRGLPIAAVVHETAPRNPGPRRLTTEVRRPDEWARLVRQNSIREIRKGLPTAKRPGPRHSPTGWEAAVPGGDVGTPDALEPLPISWLAVTNASWEGMVDLLPAALAASLQGSILWGQEVAGRAAGTSPDQFVRSLQFAVLSPMMAYDVGDSLAPWDFGEDAEAAWYRLSRLRMNLRPALSALAAVAAQTGVPVTRPMILEFPADARFTNECTQYMLGSDLLVAPVLEPGQSGRVVNFPSGVWHCALQAVAFTGPGSFAAPVGWSDAPLFLREGAAIPLQLARDAQLGEWSPDALVHTVRIEPARSPIRDLVAPLEGNPLKPRTVIAFRVLPEYKGALAAQWFFKDAPAAVFAAQPRLDDGKGTLDLTPADGVPLVGREQVYAIRGGEDPEAGDALCHGVIVWRSPVQIEVSPAAVLIGGSGECEVATRLRNTSGEAVEVHVTARVGGRGVHPEPAAQTAAVPPGGEAALIWDIVWRPDEELGDALAVFTVWSAEVTLGSCTVPFTRSPRWVVAGPFPCEPGTSGLRSFAPERSSEAGIAFATADATQRWEQVEASRVQSDGCLDFGRLFGRSGPGCAYAMTRIYSDSDRTVELRFGGDDALGVWLNGRHIFESAGTGERSGQSVATVRLRQNVNTLLIKVCQERGPWDLRFRLTGIDEQPAHGVKDGFFSDYARFSSDRPVARVIPAEDSSRPTDEEPPADAP